MTKRTDVRSPWCCRVDPLPNEQQNDAIWLDLRADVGLCTADAGWSSSVARWAHNPEVTGSNPVPATTKALVRSPFRSYDERDLIVLWQQFGSTRSARQAPDPGSSAGLKSVAYRWRHRVQTQELKSYRIFESRSTRTVTLQISRVEVAAVGLSRPPLFKGATDVMRHLGTEVLWSDRTRPTVNVRQRTRLLQAIDNGADRLGLKVKESWLFDPQTSAACPRTSTDVRFSLK
jgi:hypothetical protein